MVVRGAASGTKARRRSPSRPSSSLRRRIKQHDRADPNRACGCKEAAAVVVGIDAERREEVKADGARHYGEADGGADGVQAREARQQADQQQRRSKQLRGADRVLAEEAGVTEEARRAERGGPAVQAAEDFLRLRMVGEFVAEAIQEHGGGEDRDRGRCVLADFVEHWSFPECLRGGRSRPPAGYITSAGTLSR